mmetsp:Transcript_9194/g.11344  ORF Transcript_9194/g.11344 Transcript_9194/m.11344 type:complete len:117 (+) Transcript_9194:175-525(+)
MMQRRFVFIVTCLVLGLGSRTHGFSQPSSARHRRMDAHFLATFQSSSRIGRKDVDTAQPTGALLAKKGKSENDTSEKKKLDPVELFFAFMTPWRNPNSIFIYMLIILNILGNMKDN